MSKEEFIVLFLEKYDLKILCVDCEEKESFDEYKYVIHFARELTEDEPYSLDGDIESRFKEIGITSWSSVKQRPKKIKLQVEGIEDFDKYLRVFERDEKITDLLDGYGI